MRSQKRTLPSINYDFGSVSAEMTVEGSIEHLSACADYAAAVASLTLTSECIRHGIREPRWESGTTKEIIPAIVQVGDVKIQMTFNFDFRQLRIPIEALRSIVTGNIMPAVLQTVGSYIDELDRLVSASVPSIAAGVMDPLHVLDSIEQRQRLQEDATTTPPRRQAAHA